MNTLAIQDSLAKKYGYSKLSDKLSKQYRNIYKTNIPEHIANADISSPFYSLNGSLITNGFTRIVIGDYGAFIEFTREQANKTIFKIKRGEEYRISDPSYALMVKYVWLTIDDGSDIKIYFQKQRVSYADYKEGLFYVSPYHVKLDL